MNILITTSNSYIPYAAVLLQSLSEKNADMIFDVYIVCPDITEDNKLKLHRQFTRKSQGSSSINEGSINILFPVINHEILNEITELSSHLIKTLNLYFIIRLYASHILPDSVKQILYLDVDTVVTSSLKELDEIRLDDETALAAVKDLVRNDDYDRLGIDISEHVYFNSCVMLLNLDYWRRHNIGDKCIQLLVKNSTLYKMPDQDALNVVCQGHVLYLHPKFNCLIFFYARREFLKSRIRAEEFENVLDAIKSPAIIHYVFVNKPWYKGGYLPKREIWLSVLSRTEWKDMPIVYKNGIKGRLQYIIKSLISNLLPLIGLNPKSDIFLKKRYKHIELFFLIVYYGFAYWLPNFDARFLGKFSNALRVLCVKNIFDYVGNGVNIGRKARFGNGRKIWIDSRSNIGANCLVPNNIIIGKDVMMGPNNFFFGNFTHNISDTSRPMIDQGFKMIEGNPEIGDDVWIGRECLFMPCLKIGSHSVVGARSVVTKDVPERVVVAGSPARIVKERK